MHMELTLVHKIEIAFVLAVLTVAGFLFLRGTRQVDDLTINAWAEQRKVGMVDPNKPVSASNPVDPKRSPTIYVFAFFDGMLKIAEYPPESGLRDVITFEPDIRRDQYQIYKNPWAKVDKIDDAYKHTLARAAYSAAEGRPLHLLVGADLTAEQLKTENQERQAMLDQIAIINEGTKTGTFAPESYEKVLTALINYHSLEADPTKDPAKAKLARAVVEIALDYIEKAQVSKGEFIDKYIASIDTILQDDQKTKLGEYGKQVADRRTQRRFPRRTTTN